MSKNKNVILNVSEESENINLYAFRSFASLRMTKLKIMAWFLILAVLLAALVYRIIACIKKSKQSGEEWNLADKYAANDFGE